MFFTKDSSTSLVDTNVDEYGDSFARDTSVKELRETFDSMPKKFESSFSVDKIKAQLNQHHHDFGELRGWIFSGMLIYVDPLAGLSQQQQTLGSKLLLRMKLARTTAQFAGAKISRELQDNDITHVVVGDDRDRVRELRKVISS